VTGNTSQYSLPALLISSAADEKEKFFGSGLYQRLIGIDNRQPAEFKRRGIIKMTNGVIVFNKLLSNFK
jgi:hypothetical protein